MTEFFTGLFLFAIGVLAVILLVVIIVMYGAIFVVMISLLLAIVRSFGKDGNDNKI